jgi:cell division protease FtsH
MSDEEKKNTAYHEAGHALVAKLVPGAAPINKATIIPRGQALGMVSYLEEEMHMVSVTETKLRAHLATGLAGRCAEKLVFGELTPGAQNDYKQVTSRARAMVCEWGMNKELGPLSFGSDDDEVFLGKEFTRTRNFSEQTAQAIDQEIKELVLEAEQTASDLLKKNQDKLHVLAQALLEYEVLDDGEIDRILAGESLAREGPQAAFEGGDGPGAEAEEESA